MKKDKFSDINGNKKNGKMLVVVAAVAALCLAGLLCAGALKKASGSVYLDMRNVEISGGGVKDSY